MNLKSVAIIGGAGKMGRWFTRFFVKEGFRVVVSGRTQSKLAKLKEDIPEIEVAKDNVAAVKDVDIVVISVLQQNFESIIREIRSYLKPRQIIIDITSVKETPVKIMHRYIKDCVTLGTHPVFGPSVTDYNQNFILTPTNNKEKDFAVGFKKWLEERGFRVSVMSPKRHDHLMSTVLGLSHFIGFVTCETWLDMNLKELKKVSGTSFKTLFNLVDNVVHSDPDFYSELQMSFPDVDRIEERFEFNVRKWLKIVKRKNKDRFTNEMERLRKNLDDLG
jgi:prephenate dehydrogenase